MPGELQIESAREEDKWYPYRGIFFGNRHSFWAAGQDSWTQPPAQNSDLFIALTNVEPVLKGILQRRRGYSLFASTFGFVFPRSYAFRAENLGLRRIIWSSASSVVATDEAGMTVKNPVFTPSAQATFAPRMVLSRDYGFFADGAAADYKKWDGTSNTNNLTNWGISNANTPGSSFGPNNCGTGADIAGAFPWANPTRIQGAPDGSDATNTVTYPGLSDPLVGTNYGFAIASTAPITGITVLVTGFQSNANATTTVFLTKDGTHVIGTSKTLAGSFIGAANVGITLGGTSDLWGATWANTDINSANFGVIIQFNVTGGTSTTVNIDAVQVTVNSQPGALAFTTNTSTTNIVLQNGRTYFYTYQNSKTGSNSGLSPASASTGPLAGNQVNITGIPTSSDAQVDTVNLLATADGNDQTTLYLLGSVSNGTATFNDTIADSVLITKALYLNTDASGVIHGVANNNPPPTINFPTKHKGRLYGAVGRALFFSKNLDEVTTANGLITSRWEEAWPATNQFDISDQAETIQALLSDGETLWIASERSIRRLIGDSPSNFQKPEVQFNEVGVLNQETWKVVFTEGAPVGTMWLTPDFRVIASDFNTYVDVGTPIQDVLSTTNNVPGATIFATYVNAGPADYYMLYLPTGANTVADTICVFNLRSKKWFIWKPTDLCSTALFNISAAGLPQWLFATLAGPLYSWDTTLTVVQDRVNNTPVSYPVTMQTSWLDLGDYTLRKFVNQIIPTTADQSAMTVAVDAASNELDFNSPLSVVAATTVVPAAIPTDVFVPLASGPSHSRAFRFTFVSPASTIQNVLTGFSIEAGSFHKY